MLNVFYCLNRELRCVVQYGELRWHLSTCLGETKSLSIVTASVIHFLYEWWANRYKRPGSERFNPRLCNLALLLIRSLCDVVLLLYMKVYNTILFNVESTRSGCPLMLKCLTIKVFHFSANRCGRTLIFRSKMAERFVRWHYRRVLS